MKREEFISMHITYQNLITVEDYNALRSAVGWAAYDIERARFALERSDFIAVAQIGGQAIGMARVIHDGVQAMIMDVIVAPEHQRQGIGRALMARVMDYLGELARGGEIKAHLMAVSGKEEFYEKFGFFKRPQGRYGCGMTKIFAVNSLRSFSANK